MTTAVQFDPASHTFRDDFGEVPSVTTILRHAGLVDSRWFTPETRTRGQYVAAATQMMDEGDLDESALDPALRPYCDAWQAFKDDSGFEVEGIEEPVYCSTYRYAGILDRHGRMNGTKGIVDIKTGATPPWHGLQLSGYAMTFKRPMRRFGVTLKPNGKYSLKQYDDPADNETFLAALTLASWKSKHGVKHDE